MESAKRKVCLLQALLVLTMAGAGTCPAHAQSEPTLDELERKLEQAERKRAADARANRPARRDPEKPAQPAPQGTLIVRSDVDCALAINGQAMGRLTSGQTRTLRVNPGQSLIECTGEGASRATAVQEVRAGEQAVVLLAVPAPPVVNDKVALVLTGELQGAATADTYFGDQMIQNTFDFRSMAEPHVLAAVRSVFPTAELTEFARGEGLLVRVTVEDMVWRNNSIGKGFDATCDVEVRIENAQGRIEIQRRDTLKVHGIDHVALFRRYPDNLSKDMMSQFPTLLTEALTNRLTAIFNEKEIVALGTAGGER